MAKDILGKEVAVGDTVQVGGVHGGGGGYV